MIMATALSVDPETAAGAMESVDPASGRGRTLEAGGMTILDESYNANPDSVTACLNVLEKIPGDRGAVLGDMRELGERAVALHSEILKKADSLGLRFLILTGPVFCSLSKEVENTDVYRAKDWKRALKLLRKYARMGTTVLVKGSNSLRLSDMVRAIEEEG
jgi:UDP-N-acetylmuramoyl-tripeptide--D-alanyl-D-alanine ligase